MKDLRVKEAKSGMILAKPVLDKMGRTLLKKGEPLTRPVLDRLDTWGVIQVAVETPAEEEAEPAAKPRDPLSESQVIEAIGGRLSEQFQRHAQDPRMGVIRESAKKALVKRQVKKG